MKRLFTKFLGGCLSVFGFVTLTDLRGACAATVGCELKWLDGDGNPTDERLGDAVTLTVTRNAAWLVGYPNNAYTGGVGGMWWNLYGFYNNFEYRNKYSGNYYYLPSSKFSNSTINSYCLKSTKVSGVANWFSLDKVYTVSPACAMDYNGYALYVRDDASGLLTSHFGCCLDGSGSSSSSGYSGSSGYSTDNCPCFYKRADTAGSFNYGGSSYSYESIVPISYRYCFLGCESGTYQSEFVEDYDKAYSGTFNMPSVTFDEQKGGTTGCVTLVFEPGLYPTSMQDTDIIPTGMECYVPRTFKGFHSYTGRCSDGCDTTYMYKYWDYHMGQCQTCPGIDSVANKDEYLDDDNLVTNIIFVSGDTIPNITDCYATAITGIETVGEYTYSCGGYYSN